MEVASTSNLATRLGAAYARASEHLLAQRNGDGVWRGELSSSALSTATAVCALALVDRATGSTKNADRISAGIDWLVRNANEDGGWGDTILSISNISTTCLCWAAFGAVSGADEKYRDTVARARNWITGYAGSDSLDALTSAIIHRYGNDRTFSVPILTMCALAGRLGEGREAWRAVIQLPFELATLPHAWFAALRLPVVSYALPALIAIGLVKHRRRPTRNPVLKALRNAATRRALAKLETIQPSSGGFLEATPLTSFVTMSLIGAGESGHPVVERAVEFLERSMRSDGSWPIDTDLATWVTTLSVNALRDEGGHVWRTDERESLKRFLLDQQYREIHPYTNAAPGGWAWTELPGGVPDADDTPGALLALANLGSDETSAHAARMGVEWLLDLQNGDGGIPTFCRGWGKLEFDRSSPDLTAHTIRAWKCWLPKMPVETQTRIQAAMRRAIGFLKSTQREDGLWSPLWFGNQYAEGEVNLIYGTSRVLIGLLECGDEAWAALGRGAVALLKLQNTDGGWGDAGGGASTVEETALALEALASVAARETTASEMLDEIRSGAEWLVSSVETERWLSPAPIGFYFAKLWYFEKLYPQIFTVAALAKLKRMDR